MADEKKDEHKPVVLVLAAVVALAGLAVAIVSMNAVSSQSLLTVDKIVRMDAGANHGSVPTFTTIRIYKGLIGVGVAIIVAATLGLFGANRKSKPLIAVYLGFTVLFSLVMFLSGASLFMRITAVTPIIDRQVIDFCNVTTYERLTSNLDCPNSLQGADRPECGDVCETRVGLLQRYDGCAFLADLCTTRWEYITTDTAYQPGMTGHFTSTNADECASICSRDMGCIGFVDPLQDEETGCFIRTSLQPPENPRYQWSTQALPAPDPDGATTVRWHDKNRPYALPAFHSYGRKLAFSVFGLAVVIVLSMVATCCHLYTVNVSRAGKHTGPELFATLLCPCWGKAPHEKIAELEGLASSEEE